MTSSSHLICREARVDDQESIVQFQLALALESENLKLDLQTCSKGVAHVFKNPHIGTYFVAEKSSKVIGSLLILSEWSDWRNGFVWWIHSVYVLPEAREHGVFSSLYRFIQEKGLVEHQIRGLRLYVDKTNVHAQKVYQKLGMTNHHYELYEWMRNS
jgi:ribosomal protein S18 acetylase RimI-like enzyme